MAPPLEAERLARIGWAASEANEHTHAVAALEQCVRLAPNHVPYLNALGLALARALKPVEALPYLLKSLALKPDDIEIACAVGEISVERLDSETAGKWLKQCLTLDPKAQHPAGVRARGLIKKAEKQLKKSLGKA